MFYYFTGNKCIYWILLNYLDVALYVKYIVVIIGSKQSLMWKIRVDIVITFTNALSDSIASEAVLQEHSNDRVSCCSPHFGGSSRFHPGIH